LIIHLISFEIFERQKAIFDDIHAHTAFGDVSLSDGETLKNLLNGIVKNKLDAVDQLVNSKSFF
jgi:phage replication initiation protein